MLIGNEQTPKCQYYNPFGGVRAAFLQREFHIACARGENAGGLIGTEYNGIFILCHKTKSVLLDRHMPLVDEKGRNMCWLDSANSMGRMAHEIDRIAEMGDEEFRSFIAGHPRARFDPFAEHKDINDLKKRDQHLRREYSEISFAGSTEDRKKKRQLVHEWERFCVAAFHASEETVILKRFTKSIYYFLHLRCGYIAHYNRFGFFDAQLRTMDDRRSLIRLVAKGSTTYGTPILCDADLMQALQKISSKYL